MVLVNVLLLLLLRWFFSWFGMVSKGNHGVIIEKGFLWVMALLQYHIAGHLMKKILNHRHCIVRGSMAAPEPILISCEVT